MSDITERVGSAQVLLGDRVVATGTYNLVLEQAAANGDAIGLRPVRARGTLRLDDGHRAHKAMSGPSVRVRMDGKVDVAVEVHLYVPGASFVAFTCADLAALDDLLRRSPSA